MLFVFFEDFMNPAPEIPTITLAPVAMKILFCKKDCNGKREKAT
ncbi:hypothetical protein ACFP3I_08790 [Chryseobacterium arachidis]